MGGLFFVGLLFGFVVRLMAMYLGRLQIFVRFNVLGEDRVWAIIPSRELIGDDPCVGFFGQCVFRRYIRPLAFDAGMFLAFHPAARVVVAVTFVPRLGGSLVVGRFGWFALFQCDHDHKGANAIAGLLRINWDVYRVNAACIHLAFHRVRVRFYRACGECQFNVSDLRDSAVRCGLDYQVCVFLNRGSYGVVIAQASNGIMSVSYDDLRIRGT